MIYWALLFNLIMPGAGQIFLGQFVEGILFGLLFCLGRSALLPLSLRLFKVSTLKQTLKIFYVCNWCYILLIFISLFAVFFQRAGSEKKYFLETIFFIISARLIYKQTFNSFIFTTLSGRSGVWKILQNIRKSSSEKIEK